MKNKIGNINWREILVNVMGFFVARTTIYSMNPIGIGYFIAAYGEKKNRLFLFLSVAAGMATALPPVKLAKYYIIMLVFGLVTGILEKMYDKVSTTVTSFLGAAITVLFALFDLGEWTRNQSYCALAVLEGVLVLAAANLFYLGIGAMFQSSKTKALENEELISVAILLGAVVYSMPDFTGGKFSLMETAAYLIVLYFGYRYGSGGGTVSGVICGLIIAVETGNPIVVGIYGILGLAVGMFRELGRVPTAMLFLVLTIGLGFFYEISLIQIASARGLASALTIFLLTPKRFMKRCRLSGQKGGIVNGNEFAQENLKTMARYKIADFSDAFEKLSKTFYQMSEVKRELNERDIEEIFDNLSQRICSNCVNCKHCWSRNTYDRYQTSFSILNAAKQRGMVLAGDMPEEFKDTCLKFNTFLNETNKELSLANLNLNWNNRMAESREAIASQLGEVSNIMNEFANDLLEMEEGYEEEERMLERELEMQQLDVKKIAIMENRNKQIEVFLLARMKGGGCMTTREAASIAGNVLGKRLKPSFETKNIISKNLDRVILTEDTNFKVITGIARKNKEGERVSGDNYSFLQLDSGEMVMTLSDGMGTGEEAYEQSESLVELLEQCMEAGFSEQSAIRLINSILVLKPNGEAFTTLDMSVINLFSGKCNFLKMGASTTFIKRSNWVEAILSTTLPVGVFHQMDIDNISKKLYDGDFIIMVSDGILDSISMMEPERYMEELLAQIDSNNPQEIADFILECAEREGGGVSGDDRTVLVAGFWKK